MVNGWVKLLVCYKALSFKFAKLEWSLYKCPLNIKRPLCLKVAKLGTLAAIREYMFFLLNVRLRSKLLFFVTTVVCSICKVSFAWKFPGYVKRSDVPYWFQGQVFKGQGKTANVCLIFKDLLIDTCTYWIWYRGCMYKVLTKNSLLVYGTLDVF